MPTKNSFLIGRKDLRGKNPSPFYVSFYSVSIDGKEVKEVDMIAPQSTKKWLLPQETHGKEIKWQAINDYGGSDPCDKRTIIVFARGCENDDE